MWPAISKTANLVGNFAFNQVPSFFGLTPGRDSRYKFPPIQQPERADATREKVKTAARFPAFLPYFDETQNLYETAEMRRQYRRMLADPNVKSALLGKIVPVTALELKFHPANDKPRYKEHADFLDWNIKRRMVGGLMGFAWNILIHQCIDGVAINEKVWTFQDGERFHAKRVLKELKPKDPDQDCVLWIDEFKNVTGVMGLKWNAGEIWSPKEFLITTHQPLYGNPTGMSDFRACYGRWWMLDSVTKMRGRGAEKRAEPIVWGEYPDGTKQNSVQNILAHVKSSNWAAVPAGVKMQVLDVAGSSSDYFETFTSSLREEIFLGIAGAILQNLTGGEGEMRGNSKVHQNTAAAFKWALTNCVCQALNDYDNGLIQDMLVGAGNYRDVWDYPYATMTGVDDAELAESMTIDTGLKSLGYVDSQKGLEERYGRQLEKQPDQVQGGMGGVQDSLSGLINPPTEPEGEDPDATSVDSDSFSEWSGYQGPSGGRGWKNSATGEIRYQKDSPQADHGPRAGKDRGGGRLQSKSQDDRSGVVDLAKSDRIASTVQSRTKGVLVKLGAAGKWMKVKTRQVYDALEKRYGRKQALAIFAAGHVVGLATPGFNLVPGSTLIAMAPFAALAETYLQIRKAAGFDEDTDSWEAVDIQGAAKGLIAGLLKGWQEHTKGQTFAEDQSVNALTATKKFSTATPGAVDEDNEQLWKECLALIPKEKPTSLPATIGKIGDITVKLVDGNRVKIDHDMNFVEAGNFMRYKWIPHGEVWLDASMDRV